MSKEKNEAPDRVEQPEDVKNPQNTTEPTGQDQPTQPNDEAADELAALKAEIADLKALLNKRPADEHKGLEPEQGRKPEARACHLSKSARDLYNSLP